VDIWKEFDQNVVTHSAAHHLMAVDDLLQKLGYARVSDVARRLNITRGSVSISLQPLKRAGLLLQDENRHIRLSERGQILPSGSSWRFSASMASRPRSTPARWSI
jgi:Mn-dependent DtxR family transcriptional regulator